MVSLATDPSSLGPFLPLPTSYPRFSLLLTTVVLGSPLAAVDLYHFAVTDGTEIELTVRSPQGEYRARYIVCPADRREHSSFLWLDIVKPSQQRRTIRRSDEQVRLPRFRRVEEGKSGTLYENGSTSACQAWKSV